MIDMRTAIAKASDFLRSAYADEEPTALRLEEVDRVEDESGKYWLITLSFYDDSDIPIAEAKRAYKVVKVDGTTGEALSMKIRNVYEHSRGYEAFR